MMIIKFASCASVFLCALPHIIVKIPPSSSFLRPPASTVDISLSPTPAMQGVQRRRCSNDALGLDLSTATATAPSTASLSIDEAEPAEARIQRLISEHPVIIFSRSSCCMCHVMKKLLGTIGVHPTVIELDDDEVRSLGDGASTPSAFIGGSPVGGLDSLFALHLSGRLIPMLVAVGALYDHAIPS